MNRRSLLAAVLSAPFAKIAPAAPSFIGVGGMSLRYLPLPGYETPGDFLDMSITGEEAERIVRSYLADGVAWGGCSGGLLEPKA